MRDPKAIRSRSSLSRENCIVTTLDGCLAQRTDDSNVSFSSLFMFGRVAALGPSSGNHSGREDDDNKEEKCFVDSEDCEDRRNSVQLRVLSRPTENRHCALLETNLVGGPSTLRVQIWTL